MEQLLFNIIPSDQYKIEDYIVSNSNREAYNKITNWSQNWGVEPYKYSLLISGPASCGKSYLAKIFQQLVGAYLIGPEFNSKELDINLITQHDAFVVEDIENWQEDRLFHYFNLINEHQKYLLLTSNKNYTSQLLDLRSRVNSIARIILPPPDQETMQILLFKMFSSHSIALDQKVLKFLVGRLPRQFDKIFLIAAKIIHHLTLNKKKMTISAVKEVL